MGCVLRVQTRRPHTQVIALFFCESTAQVSVLSRGNHSQILNLEYSRVTKGYESLEHRTVTREIMRARVMLHLTSTVVPAWCFGSCLMLADFFELSLSGWWWLSGIIWHSEWYVYEYFTVTVCTFCLTGEANLVWASVHVWFPIQYIQCVHLNHRILIWHAVYVTSYCTHCVLIVLHMWLGLRK